MSLEHLRLSVEHFVYVIRHLQCRIPILGFLIRRKKRFHPCRTAPFFQIDILCGKEIGWDSFYHGFRKRYPWLLMIKHLRCYYQYDGENYVIYAFYAVKKIFSILPQHTLVSRLNSCVGWECDAICLTIAHG